LLSENVFNDHWSNLVNAEINKKQKEEKKKPQHADWVCEDIAIANMCVKELDGRLKISSKTRTVYYWNPETKLWNIEHKDHQTRVNDLIISKITRR
jgi:hypothetical protein